MKNLSKGLSYLAFGYLLGACSSGAEEHHEAAHTNHEQHTQHAQHTQQEAHAGHEHVHQATLPVATPLPDVSIYQLESRWTDQSNQSFTLASLRGKPTVVLMFYGSCTTVCPLLISDLLRLDALLDARVRAQTQYLLVSFDPATDTPVRLAELARTRQLDTNRFRLVTGSEADIRAFANTLGVQYRRTSDGQYAHSMVLSLLDANGVLHTQVEGTGQPLDPMATALAQLVP
ncbi:MAG: SCO family protein [Sandaracinaceae bacterium]|nr:SCO family protein [Sandaracinaceae bacterium]